MSGNLRRLGFSSNLPEWHAEGACGGFPALDWYSDTADEIAAVKAVCAGCPIQVTCLQDAIDRREAWGVWGGLDPDERAAYAKRLGAGAPTIVRHGERSRYVGTKNTPGCRCDLCTRAHADYEHRRRLLKAERDRAGWTRPTKPCAHCGQQFTPRQTTQRYCAHECNSSAQKWRQQTVRRSKRCAVCTRSMPPGKKRYCSQECAKRGSRQLERERRLSRQIAGPECLDTAA